jgi:hypothetical protein
MGSYRLYFHMLSRLFNGLAQAFVRHWEDFISDDSVALVLGDMYFLGANMDDCCDRIPISRWCCIYPRIGSRGAMGGEFDANFKALSIEENH